MLSGGERNRLLLARLFLRPANLLIMDEPTNDLDLETLDILRDTLLGYKGTLILISHDRISRFSCHQYLVLRHRSSTTGVCWGLQ